MRRARTVDLRIGAPFRERRTIFADSEVHGKRPSEIENWGPSLEKSDFRPSETRKLFTKNRILQNWGPSRGNMGELSEFWEFLKSLNFGRLETVEFRPETLEFRSDISNLGTFLEHFWQYWNFGPFGVSSSSQQRIWYKFESYPYEKTTPDAGDGWARISLFKF